MSSAYFALRERLLGPLGDQLLTTDQLCEAGRVICGCPESLSLYGVPAPELTARGLRVLGRTAVECSKDPHPSVVAELIAELTAGLTAEPTAELTAEPAAEFRRPLGRRPMVVDLFCGSGNLGHHLGRRLGHPVYAAELDPLVYATASHNLDRVGSSVVLRLADYREVLAALPARSECDTYVVEPPWGAAFTPDGLDLTRTEPPVPQILDDVRRSRDGLPCLVVIKTNDRIVNGSLDGSFEGGVHLRSFVPEPVLPTGLNAEFHIYRLGERPPGPSR
ncbi:hypothetical protein BX285_6646 [Streptomyces sp. 1114.5]|uniref:hypothetical protein n=1 Tax=Streptomyces sp. 1114.5 TaxID=1938830 RepID=UPI000EAE298A|nr:hypothetical protein [Streptomyces sp. 1114.5]RKT09551.1 hypothetical protein BX285_6646 [Streptomyces sp. 1114.5]